MKRLLVFIMTTLLIGSMALAESIDLANMGTDELMQLYIDMQTELYQRDLGKNLPIRYQGKYKIGEDIEPGNYYVTGVGESDPDGETDWVVLETVTDFETREKIDSFICEPGETFFYKLEEGNYLWIRMGTCIFNPVA